MFIDKSLPSHVMRVLTAKGLMARFEFDMCHLRQLDRQGDIARRNRYAEIVMGYVTNALGCDLKTLDATLNALAPAPARSALTLTICSRLFAERERLGLSVAQLADIGNVSASDQLHLEAGDSQVPSTYLAQVARDAGIDALFVLTGRREANAGAA